MIKDIDYYFDSDTWIIPDSISVNGELIKNSGLKIKADFLNPKSIRSWGNYYYENWNTLGVLYKNKLLGINIRTSNLLRIIQYCGGISESGFLKGTYRLTKMKGKVYDIFNLIPEDSRENLFKSEVSKIYYDSKLPFTCKMIPGHLYVSKCGYLYICIKNKILTYASNGWSLGLSDVPKQEKVLMVLTEKRKRELDRISPKTFQEFMQKFINNKDIDTYIGICTFSYKFSGKDLGQLFTDDELTKYFTSEEILSTMNLKILLSDELWKTNNLVREKLISMVEKLGYNGNNNAFIKLKNELGIL